LANQVSAICSAPHNAITSPVYWEAGDVNLGNPCASDPNIREQSLIIPRCNVTDPNDPNLIRDFVIGAHAKFDPNIDLENFLPDIQEAVKWTKISVPNSGYLYDVNKLDAEYKHPKVGGLYELEFQFPDYQASRTRALFHLPLAGADMTSWLENELKGVPAWATSVRNDVEDYYSEFDLTKIDGPGLVALKRLAWWLKLSGKYFDHILDPISADEKSPCEVYKQPLYSPDGEIRYTYVTVNGVVVHGVKINNMIWAAFARAFGWPKGSAYLGSELNQFGRGILRLRIEIDTPAASYAVSTGEGKIYDWIKSGAEEPLTEILDVNDLLRMQEPDDTILHILWPSPDPLDPSKSSMIKPDLLVPWP
jgi:hypothetical protein